MDTDEKSNPPDDGDEKYNSPRPATNSPEKQQMHPSQRYQIVKDRAGNPIELAETLFGHVYRGLDKVTGGFVIIKLSSKRHVEKGIAIKTGLKVMEDPVNESRLYGVLGKEQCPYVAKMLAWWDSSQHWITQVLEFYPGKELLDSVKMWQDAGIPPQMLELFRGQGRQSSAPPSLVTYKMTATEIMARFYFKQLAIGVNHIHSRNISHRDLSLENLMLDKDGNLRIIDFGLAKAWKGDNWRCGPGITQEGPVGKHGYWSYECNSAMERVDARRRPLPAAQQPSYDSRANDVWSIGVILYMMLFGIPPFEVPHEADKSFAYLWRHGVHTNLKWQTHRWWNAPPHRDYTTMASPMAVDLLQKIFRPEAERITMEQILQHPIFLIPLSQCVSG